METSRKEFLLAPSALFIIILLTSLASLRAYANNSADNPPATVTCVTPTIFNVGHGSQTDEYGGVNVTLSGSQPGVRYDLIFTPLPAEGNTGSVVRTMNGAISSLEFEPVYEEGVYTIVGTRVSGGCSATMNGSYTLAIVPEQFEVFGGGTHCEGGSGVTIKLSGSQPRVKYQLKVNDNPVGEPLNGNTSMLAWNNVTGSGNYTVTAFSQTNTTGMAGSASVTEIPAPQKFTIGGDGTYVMGQADIPITLSGSQPGVSYQLMAEGANYKVGKPVPGTGEALTWNIDAFSARLFVVATNTTHRCVADMDGRVYISTSSVQADANRLDALAFRYKYDDQRRMIAKKIPGAAWQYIVYDDRNRVVLTQDGEQRKINQWTFTKYDALNRPVMTGLYVHPEAATPETMQGLIGSGTAFETYNGDVAAHGYTNIAFPTTGHTVLTATYYDNYAFKQMLSGTVVHSASGNSEADYNYRNNEISGQETTALASINGYTTATKVNILGTDDYLWSVNYYDRKKRIIQSIADNAKGGTDRVTNVYDFTGKVTSTRTTHQVEGGTPRAVSKRFTYDHAGRLITTSHEITESVSWTNVTGATVSNDYLTNSSVSGVNSGAEAAQQFGSGQNVWVETLVDQTNRDKFIGFHPADGGGTPCEMKYRLGLRHNGQLQVFENGVSIGVVGSFAVGDRVGLERIGDVVYYKKNGEVLHTSQVPSAGKIKIKACFQNDAARFYKTTIGYGEVLLLENEYNELGQLVTKKLHSEDNGSSFMQHADYRYNIRGWLARINNADLNTNPDGGPRDYFGMEFGYDNDLGVGEYDPQFNGNISAVKWSANLGIPSQDQPKQRAYSFEYDPMNRLRKANHATKVNGWTSSNAYREAVEYDLNGNIQRLNRNDSNGSPLDRLTYNYGTAGNQLLSVTDNGIVSLGFKDRNTWGNDFMYDARGNMIIDRNKGIQQIHFNNYLNLTEEISKDNGQKIKYVYSASGIKLSQEVYAPGAETPSKRTHFIGPFIYEDDTLKSIQHSEGKTLVSESNNSDSSPEYQYQIRDHLGNVRLTFTSKKKAVEFKATMEDTGQADYSNPRVQEMAYFGNLFESEIRNVNRWLNHTSEQNGNAVYLDGSEERTVGPYTILKVHPGDTVRMEAYGKFERKEEHASMPLATLLATLVNPVTQALNSEARGIALDSDLGGLLAPFLGGKSNDNSRPQADLNYILFDKNLNIVSFDYDRMEESAGFEPTEENAATFDRLSLQKVIDRVGYLYIYVSNESPGSRVWMDDLTITYIHSPVVQFEDYYPFGLSMEGDAFERGNDRYKGQVTPDEFKDLGFRNYDAALGRFHAVDPLAELQIDLSTYQYAANDPVNQVDLLGLNAADFLRDLLKKLKSIFTRKAFTIEQSSNGMRVKNIQIGLKPTAEKRRQERQQDRAHRRVEREKAREQRRAEKVQKGETGTDGPSQNDTPNSGGNAGVVVFFNGPDQRGNSSGRRGNFGNNEGTNSQHRPPFAGSLPYNDARDSNDGGSPTGGDLPLPVVRDNNMAQGTSDPERWERLVKDHSLNEARALLYNAIARGDDQSSSEFIQNTRAATENGDTQLPAEESGSTLLVVIIDEIEDGVVVNRIIEAVVELSPGDEVGGQINFEFDLTKEDGEYTVDYVLVKASEDNGGSQLLLEDARKYGEQFIQSSYDNRSDAIRDINKAVNETREYLATHVSSDKDVDNFVGSYDQTKQLEESVREFREEQGIDSKVVVVDRNIFEKLKEEYEEGKLTPEKDVTILMGQNPDGTYEKHIVYKENFFSYPTEKVVTRDDGTQEAIQLEGTKEEIDATRDEYIDKAINDNEIEGLGLIEDPALNIQAKAMWVIKVTKETLEKVKIPEPLWHKEKHPDDYPFGLQPVAGGIGDGIVDEAKSTVDLLTFGLSMFDKEERSKLSEFASNFSVETVKTMFEAKADKYTNQGPEVAMHEGGYDAVQIASVFWGGAFTKGGKAAKTAGEVDDLVGKIDNVLDDVAAEASEDISKLSGKAQAKILKDLDEDPNLLNAVNQKPELVDSWKYLDEADVDETLRRNIDALADPDAALDAIQMSQRAKPTWPEIQALWRRGNDFNTKGRAKYGDDFVEVVLKGVDGKAGKRLDTYLPPSNGGPGQIISRKATTLSEIQPGTFKNYLNELITKYPKGAELNSSKFPSGTKLDGDYKLEIPESNRSFFESSTEFQNVLSNFNAEKGVNIEIIYLVE